jgi:uncharacterized protein
MVATIQAKWWGSPADFKGLAPFCLTFGGIAQFLAGMWAYKARDIVATLAHGMWGAFWIAFFVLQLLQANGTVPTAGPHEADLVFGMWMVGPGKWILRTFPRAASPKTQPIELPWAEPGVKHCQ